MCSFGDPGDDELIGKEFGEYLALLSQKIDRGLLAVTLTDP